MSQVIYLPNVTSRFLTTGLASVMSRRNRTQADLSRGNSDLTRAKQSEFRFLSMSMYSTSRQLSWKSTRLPVLTVRVRVAPALVTWRVWSAVGGSCCGQLKSVSGVGRVRLCGHIKLSTLNPAVILESTSGGWESGPALQALLPAVLTFQIPPFKTLGQKL